MGLIERERPEVVCLQEVFEEDFKMFAKKLGVKGIFSPTLFVDRPGKPGFKKRGIFGVAMMGRLTGNFGSEYYFKRRYKELPRYSGKPNAGHRTLVWQEIDGGPTITSTHFTWSKNGQATQKQRRELASLLQLLDKLQPDVVCGDFNAPRGGEIWAAISQKLVDNIPPDTKTTLDPMLHYTNGLKLVVDGFFTPAPRRVRGSAALVNQRGFTLPNNEVRVKSLRMIGGVSDHLAIAAEVTMKPGLPIDS